MNKSTKKGGKEINVSACKNTKSTWLNYHIDIASLINRVKISTSFQNIEIFNVKALDQTSLTRKKKYIYIYT